MEEETGHLDDIYNVKDLNLKHGDFDYVEGGGNDYGTFEKAHHMKNIKNEQAEDYINYDDNFEDPDNEDDGFEDINASEVTDEIEEQGGNAPDFDISNVDPAYDFVSDGPMAGGDSYPVYEDMDEECDECYEKMESAWNEEIDETDISGVQGIYGDMDPAYDFDSEGPGKAGPYQHSQYNEGETDEQYLPKHEWNKMKRRQDAEKSGEDFDADELDITDYEDDFDPKDSSWEDISALVGSDEFSHVDEDIRESVVKQQGKIMEMFNRMKVIK